MKKVNLFFVLLSLCFSFYSFMFLEHTIENILKQLDISETKAKEHIWSNIVYHSFYFPSPKTMRNTPESERPAIVKTVGNFVKAYTKTDEFAKLYKENIASKKPEPPKKPDSMDETRKKQKEEMKKSISEMEANKKKMPVDQQASFDEAIKMLKQQLKEIDNPDNPMYSNDTDKYLQMGYEEQMKEYSEKLAKWEQEYNSSPDLIVKQWLTEFLDQTKNVDFKAALKEDRGKKRFINEEYERQSYLWKLCFRAGKQATEAARSFAQSWLSEIK